MAPVANCVHLLDSVTLSLKPIFPIENLLHTKMVDSSVLADSGKLHQKVSDGEDSVEPNLQLEICEGE